MLLRHNYVYSTFLAMLVETNTFLRLNGYRTDILLRFNNYG